jgi:hypothetical protein
LQTVNIDFQGGTANIYSGIGMAADSGIYWNAVGTADVFDLKASDGTTITDIDVTSTYVSTYGNPGNDLLRDRLIWSEGPGAGSFNTPTINIAGLDAGLAYNIYIYAGYYGQTYRINGVDESLTGLDWNDDQPAWVEGTHYVSFLGVSPTATTIDIDVFDVGIPTTKYGAHTVVSGMQIQAVSASGGPVPIPVPGAFVLAAIGLGMTGWMTRRGRQTVEA